MEQQLDWAARVAVERWATTERVSGLERQVAALAEQQAFTSHDDEHDPEGVTVGFERAQLLGLLAGARHDLGALDRAVDRIAAGSYGRCLGCGGRIAAERLEAVPAAETCRACVSRRR